MFENIDNLREPEQADIPAHIRYAIDETGLHPFTIQLGTEHYRAWRTHCDTYLNRVQTEERIALLREELWMTISRKIAIYLDSLSIDIGLLSPDDSCRVQRERARLRAELRDQFDQRDARPDAHHRYWEHFAMTVLRGLFAEIDDAGGVTFSDEDAAFLERLRADVEADAGDG